MAKRPVFIVDINKKNLVMEKEYEFKWYSGFSVVQKQKSFNELHKAFKNEYPDKKILEISSKSNKPEGVQLSAFNLMVNDNNGNRICSVECLFQGSKKFKNGGPYKDLIYKSSIEAKKDERLINSGDLIGFEYKGNIWGLEPKTHFYDWLYINSVYQNKELAEKIINYDAFTDIEFNPKKSLNNQARAAALFVGLYRAEILENVIRSRENYMYFLLYKKYEQMNFDI